mmetsp:Transcript_7504/g.24079  ORF Transcript_7504/g.24079 Transcript_7504/m.24079 type:complete len:235 (-) Transcript_7504:383-1087(-)
MHLDMQQLNVLYTRMDNLTMQATIVIGFALAMWGGETLGPLVEEESEVCIYKSVGHRLFATLFFLSVSVTMSLALAVVVLTSQVKQLAQEAALLVSTQAAVARSRGHVRHMNNCFSAATCSFYCSAMLLVVLFVGLPKRRRTHGFEACIDVEDADKLAAADQFGMGLAIMNSTVMVSFGVLLFVCYRRVSRAYEPRILLDWHREYLVERERQVLRARRGPHPGADCAEEEDSTG